MERLKGGEALRVPGEEEVAGHHGTPGEPPDGTSNPTAAP